MLQELLLAHKEHQTLLGGVYGGETPEDVFRIHPEESGLAGRCHCRDSRHFKKLVWNALTNQINDREMFLAPTITESLTTWNKPETAMCSPPLPRPVRFSTPPAYPTKSNAPVPESYGFHRVKAAGQAIS